MKAMRLNGVNSLAIEVLDMPEPGPGEVRVRVEACGLCGSDRHMMHGEFPSAIPVTLGHEFAGIVDAVGPGVTRLSPGMRVTGDPNIACGRCAPCLAGRPNLCTALEAIGVTRDGGFAEYLVMPEGQGYVLPADLPAVHAALCEPIACCIHAMDVARIVPGMSVAILGGGVIGLIMVQLARLAGAGGVMLSTRQAPRRAVAEKLGASETFDPQAGPLPTGYDVVIECAGVAETMAQSIQIAGRGGTVVIVGVMPKGEAVSFVPWEILTRELRLEAAWLNPHTHGRAADLVRTRALDLDSLITRMIPLSEMPRALAEPPAFGEIKTIALPDGQRRVRTL